MNSTWRAKVRSAAALVSALASLLCVPYGWAQLSAGGVPYGLSHSIPMSSDSYILPSVDTQALHAEDAARPNEGIPFRFGYAHEVALDMYNSGSWLWLEDGSLMWRLRLVCPGAYSINLIYSDFWLPEGGQLFLYDERGRVTLGAFTSANNKPHGRFATAPTPGDTCIIEYVEPADAQEHARLLISKVVHGYRDAFFGGPEKLYGESGACNVNVACPAGSPWYDEIRSVAMITAGVYGCTGALVNNTGQDRTPLFLTANHCWDNDELDETHPDWDDIPPPEEWIFTFNWQSPDCISVPDPTSNTLTGATLRAHRRTSDFCLLELEDDPPPSYNVYLSGWSRSNSAPASAVAIHHPRSDIKKISFEDNPLTSTADGSDTPSRSASFWRVGDWDLGTTEFGSSGCPLFDANHRIVGQLLGGWAACGNNRPDWFGKVWRSFNAGSDEDSRLQEWLDPIGSDFWEMDGLNGVPYVLAQNFDGLLWPPSGWALASSAALPSEMRTTKNATGGRGYCVDFVPRDASRVKASLTTPVFSLARPIVSACLEYRVAYFNLRDGARLDVQVSTDGAFWTTVRTYDSSAIAPVGAMHSLSLTPYVGRGTLRVRFAYSAPSEAWRFPFQVDDVRVAATNRIL